MQHTVRLSLVVCLAVALVACGAAGTPAAPPAPGDSSAAPIVAPPTSAPAAPMGSLFFARPQGAAGPLLAYDMARGNLRFSLPAGLLSADQEHYLGIKAGEDSDLLAFDLNTGAERSLAHLRGQWALSSLSATGRWAALTRVPTEGELMAWTSAGNWQTEVDVLDAQTGQPVHQLTLAGNFEVDTLSTQGDALFIIQYLPAIKPDHYEVRWYDLTTETLQDGALVDKREPDEVMLGQRWQAIAPRDGSWLFSLYLRPKDNTAFIHALDTQNKYTLCFDLPVVTGSTLDELRAYSLALAADGQTVYAANPALGLVAAVDLNSFTVSRIASFSPAQAGLSAAALANVGVADAHGLYFTGGQQVWAFDTATQQVKSLSSLDSRITGLALAPNGRQLFLARPDHAPILLDTISGAALSLQ